MPLRDHFRPPLAGRKRWEGFHNQWPAMIVMRLSRRLPRRYSAEPQVHMGSSIEIDVATFDEGEADSLAAVESDNGGGVATAVWAPPMPTMTIATDLPDMDAYEVRVYDDEFDHRLVAAVEIVSPSNKDRPETRSAFAAKCATLLREGVSVTIVDLVTTRHFNLYADLMGLIRLADPSLGHEPPSLYAVACRWRRREKRGLLETWMNPLAIGQPLPTLPLWIADNYSIPLELEPSYEETCRILRIP
jgi:Protein of unknown function (DUF4058)